ncbi:MAG: hypothetical protein ACRD50_15790 [Candidatus Acidiferrales bacterium]
MGLSQIAVFMVAMLLDVTPSQIILMIVVALGVGYSLGRASKRTRQ